MVVSNLKYVVPHNPHTRYTAIFMMWAGKTLRTTDRNTCSLTELMHDLVLHPDMLEDARTFFMSEGVDGAFVTTQTLCDIAFSCGLIDRGVQRDFHAMAQCIQQHRSGLINDAELIKCLQCNEYQIAAVLQYIQLPPKVTDQVALTAWDEAVMIRQSKNEQLVKPRTY